MPPHQFHGLFLTGTDTDIGKTYVGAMLVRALVASGARVGVYKPAASGCRLEGEQIISDDALTLWEAAGRPGTLDEVCPQRFLAPLAPHLAARAEGRALDPDLLRRGLDIWRGRADLVVVEGAGGLLSPLGETEYVADLAHDFGFSLIIVARNGLGTINHTLLTLHAAATWRDGLAVAGIILNQPQPPADDASLSSNRAELAARSPVPVLAEVAYRGESFSASVDWLRLAAPGRRQKTP